MDGETYERWVAGYDVDTGLAKGRLRKDEKGLRFVEVQVPVERIEAAVIRHYTSRAGDPHRHLHVQVNARVFTDGRWRGLHSVGTVDSIEATNGIGHAAVACDPEMRRTLAAHGYTSDADGEIREFKRYIGRFSQRSAQVTRNLDRYEVEWRRQHPGQTPGPALRRGWDRRAWAEHRPDKDIPVDGAANRHTRSGRGRRSRPQPPGGTTIGMERR